MTGAAPLLDPALPNAELHIHLEGAIEPELLVRFAQRNGVPLPTYDPEAWRAKYVFGDLQSFLDLHYANLAVLRTEQDFYELGRYYLQAAKAAGVRHTEPFIDAHVHLRRGIPLAAVMEGYGAAFREARVDGLSCRMILAFTRDLGARAADDLLTAAMPYRDEFDGVGLDSTEIGYPPSLFVDVYARAAAEGLHRVAHAGEEGGPDYVREAVELLGVERIDHGLRALEDDDLMRRIVDDRIALTVCPLSNVALRAVPSLAEHPARRMLELGALVTISSDDPAYFGGQVDADFAALAASGFGEAELRTLARNSFDAAFIAEPERAAWKAEVDDWTPRA